MPTLITRGGQWLDAAGNVHTVHVPYLPTSKAQIVADCGANAAAESLVPDTGTKTLAAGQVYEGRYLYGRVRMGDGAVLRNCIVEMPAQTTFQAAIEAYGVAGWLIEDVEVRVRVQDQSHFNGYAFQGAGGTLRRVKSSGTVDSFYLVGINHRPSLTILEGFVSTGLTYFEGAGVHPTDTKTHGDNVTIDGNQGKVIVRYGVLDPANSAGVFVTQTSGRTFDAKPTIEHVFFNTPSGPTGTVGSYLTLHENVTIGAELRDLEFPPGTSPARMLVPASLVSQMEWTSHGARRARYSDGSGPVPYWNAAQGLVYTYGEAA